MTMKKFAIFLFIIFCNTTFSQDLVSGGSNNWLFHTPDDGRTTLWIAPLISNEYQFGQSTAFFNNGDVIFSNNVGIGKTPSSYQHGGVNRVVDVNNPGTQQNKEIEEQRLYLTKQQQELERLKVENQNYKSITERLSAIENELKK